MVGEKLIVVACRDSFNNELAVSLMQQVPALASALSTSRRHIAVHRTSFPGEIAFDSLVLLGPDAHSGYEHQDPYLHERTIVAFPAFHCEFVGNESAGEIDYMRRNIVSTVVWEREPNPKCKIYYENRRTGIELTGTKPLLASAEEVLKVIGSLEGARGPESFLDICNFQDTKAHVEWRADGFQIEVEDGERVSGTQLRETTDWALEFLFQDCQRYFG